MLRKLLWSGVLIGALFPHSLLAEQRINQRGSTSATASKNSFAASRVHQSSDYQ